MAKSIVTVTREQAVNLFVSLGLKTASKRSDKELLNKLQKINTLVDETTDTGDDALNDLLDDILQAETIKMEFKEDKEVTEGKPAVKGKKKKVKVSSLATSPTEEATKAYEKKTKKKAKAQPKAKAKTAGKKKKAAKAKAEGKNKTTKKSSTEVDKYGARLGTIKARIYACMSKKPKTMKELMAEAGIDTIQHGYINELIKKGLAEKTEKGYALK